MTRRKESKPEEPAHSPAPDAESAEARDREERIDEILEESFPASDPPAWSSMHIPDVPRPSTTRPERPKEKADP